MLIGVPKEIKANEQRVGLTPESVQELVSHGHKIIIEKDAGKGINKTNDDYEKSGASIVNSASDIFSKSDMVVKVKEPQESEYQQLSKDQILFTYLHLSPDKKQTQGLLNSNCIAVAYETVTDKKGSLPLLVPMSEVAGRMATQVGAYHLQNIKNSGAGVLLGGVPGVSAAKVLVIGAGTAGINAMKIAIGMGADVSVMDKSLTRLAYIDEVYQNKVQTIFSTSSTVEKHCIESDLVIGTVLIPGANAPKIITRDIISKMKLGSIIVDVAIDQGGCTEVSRPTTHENPVFDVDGIKLYCVANMPGGVANTSTYALNNATLPFVRDIANKGIKQALFDDNNLLNGLNVCQGKLVYEAVAKAQGLAHVNAQEAVQAI